MSVLNTAGHDSGASVLSAGLVGLMVGFPYRKSYSSYLFLRPSTFSLGTSHESSRKEYVKLSSRSFHLLLHSKEINIGEYLQQLQVFHRVSPSDITSNSCRKAARPWPECTTSHYPTYYITITSDPQISLVRGSRQNSR